MRGHWEVGAIGPGKLSVPPSIIEHMFATGVGSHHISSQLPSQTAVLAELEALAAERRRIDQRISVLLARVNATGVTLHEHGHSTGVWWSNVSPQPAGSGRARVRVSERLHSWYGELGRAFEDGRVDWNHVVVFDRAANPRVREQMIDLLPDLIALAEVATFDRWSQEVRGIAERLDQDGGYDPARDPANNQFRLTPLTSGYTAISGQLVGELALMVRSLIEAETDRVLGRYRSDAEASGGAVEMPGRAQAAAEALAEMLERASGVPDATGVTPTPEIVVVYDEASGELSDQDNLPISATALRWLVAAGVIRALEVSPTGDPLRMGRKLRYASTHQRRALAVRDGGCVFPGCSRPVAWCDAHHVDHWDTGGPTDIENLALLCRHHHRVTHQPGWEMSRSPGEPDAPPGTEPVTFRWRTPTGAVINSRRHQRQFAEHGSSPLAPQPRPD